MSKCVRHNRRQNLLCNFALVRRNGEGTKEEKGLREGGHLTKAFRSRQRKDGSNLGLSFSDSRENSSALVPTYVIRGSGKRSRDSPGGDKRDRSVARRFTASSHLNSSRSDIFLVRVPSTIFARFTPRAENANARSRDVAVNTRIIHTRIIYV